MTVGELIERLESCDPDAEVLMAHQPSWPLQFTVAGVVTDDNESALDDWQDEHWECDDRDFATNECRSCDIAFEDTVDTDAPVSVYIVEGSHPDDTPYAPRFVFERV